MKNIISITVMVMLFALNATAQNINWKSFKENQNHIAAVNIGFDNSFSAGIGYGYKLKTKQPIVFNAEYSMPFGNNLVDDFKTKLGGQMEVVRIKNFAAAIKAHGIFRRYHSGLVTMSNFGSEFAANIGYYKTRWYAAGEFGFDKAIVTNIKNSSLMKDMYPAVRDGWYIPTGGNFFYGIQGGYSFGSNDLNLKIGKTVTQDFKTTAMLPVYLQLGFNRRF